MDEAVRSSRTIRYQRDLCRSWISTEKHFLSREYCYLETEPDRTGTEVIPEIQKIARKCESSGEHLLFVDFSNVNRTRHHSRLLFAAESYFSRKWTSIPAEPFRGFDPHAHFRTWKQLSGEWQAAKDQRTYKVAAEVYKLRQEGKSYADIAARLSALGLVSPTGRRLTPENCRKLLRKLVPD